MAARRAADPSPTLPVLARPSGVHPRTALGNARSQVGVSRYRSGHSRQLSSMPWALTPRDAGPSSKPFFTTSDRRINRFEDHDRQHCYSCHCHRPLSPATELISSSDLVSPGPRADSFHQLIGEGARAQSFPPLEIGIRSDLDRTTGPGHTGTVHPRGGLNTDGFQSGNHRHDRNVSLDSRHLGKTVLHLAAEYGHVNVVRLLLVRDVNIDLRDKMGDTALHRATQHSQMPVVELLVSANASLDIQNSSGRTALQISVIKGDASIVQLLLDQGAAAL